MVPLPAHFLELLESLHSSSSLLGSASWLLVVCLSCASLLLALLLTPAALRHAVLAALVLLWEQLLLLLWVLRLQLQREVVCQPLQPVLTLRPLFIANQY